jgi:hypothetical protein
MTRWLRPFDPKWPKVRTYLVTVNELEKNESFTERRDADKRREKPVITILSLVGNDDDKEVFQHAFRMNTQDYGFVITTNKKKVIDHLNGYD